MTWWTTLFVAGPDVHGRDPLGFFEVGLDDEVAVDVAASRWQFERLGHAGHIRGLAERPFGGELRRRRLLGRIPSGRTGNGPSFEGVPLPVGQPHLADKLAVAVGGFPWGHLAPFGGQSDHRRPLARVLVTDQREWRDFARSVAREALLGQDRSDVLRVGNLAGLGQRRPRHQDAAFRRGRGQRSPFARQRMVERLPKVGLPRQRGVLVVVQRALVHLAPVGIEHEHRGDALRSQGLGFRSTVVERPGQVEASFVQIALHAVGGFEIVGEQGFEADTFRSVVGDDLAEPFGIARGDRAIGAPHEHDAGLGFPGGCLASGQAESDGQCQQWRDFEQRAQGVHDASRKDTRIPRQRSVRGLRLRLWSRGERHGRRCWPCTTR